MEPGVALLVPGLMTSAAASPPPQSTNPSAPTAHSAQILALAVLASASFTLP